MAHRKKAKTCIPVSLMYEHVSPVDIGVNLDKIVKKMILVPKEAQFYVLYVYKNPPESHLGKIFYIMKRIGGSKQ